jgi:hypothetical protein
MSNLLYTRNNIWFYTFALGIGFGVTIAYNIIKMNDTITKMNEKIDCILDNQMRFIKLLNYNEKYDNNNNNDNIHCLNKVKDEVINKVKDEVKDKVINKVEDEVINKVEVEVKDYNLDQEYLDDNYDNVPFITKSKYLFNFW